MLDDTAANCKVDRDVALELTDTSFVAENKDAVRFSSAEMDGNNYLMMRYRPQLPALKTRERRDWIFLYESSADRDPLLARAQIEIIRGMLENAERQDTFRLIAISNRVNSFVPANLPLSPGEATPAIPVTSETIVGAVKFLEQTPLIGALDLGNGVRAVQNCARNQEYIVHVGSGFTEMGMPQEGLADQIHPMVVGGDVPWIGTKYIGIGVGKHWNRAFMKQCAEKTGGYYTQINPDESISWRTFDLMATLNTPRLLQVNVSDAPEVKQTRWLLDSNTLAQGEELCAVTRWQTMPDAVRITGSLGGEKFERTVRVEKIADKAAYIPRTWAKLEIDRLLAEDARKNRNAIVELSKALYVMTPFTSLLVLENEAMYKEFKVDRGRKDHWAMYPCPDKIPVVYEPDPTMPTDVRNAPKGLKPTVNEVLQTVCTRASPTWLASGDERGGKRLHYRKVEAAEFYLEAKDRPINLELWSELDQKSIRDTQRDLQTNGSLFFGVGVNGDPEMSFDKSVRLGRKDNIDELLDHERNFLPEPRLSNDLRTPVMAPILPEVPAEHAVDEPSLMLPNTGKITPLGFSGSAVEFTPTLAGGFNDLGVPTSTGFPVTDDKRLINVLGNACKFQTRN